MSIPQKPSLNGRIIAEFYLSSEVAKRSVLRAYAKPQDKQTARVYMYDMRRNTVAEYFKTGRDRAVLERVAAQLQETHFENPNYDQTWHKSNRLALKHLHEFKLNGTFQDVIAVKRHAIKLGKFEVRSTGSFYATFIPTSTHAKAKNVCVIVSPSGIKKTQENDRKLWVSIEGEVAFQAAASHGVPLNDGIMYLDLIRGELHLYQGPKSRIWAEMEATCERIFRDWRDIRLEIQL
jgi:hypothetical protein